MRSAEAPIYVVVSADDLTAQLRALHDPGRQTNPIVFETNVIGSTLERERRLAAALEAKGYGACRVARLVFEDVDGTPL